MVLTPMTPTVLRGQMIQAVGNFVLAADGESTVMGRKYINRGYEHFESKLADLGGRISECPGEGEG